MAVLTENPSVDIFSIPHLRMKELVKSNLDQVVHIKDFDKENSELLENILQSVYEAMWELKSHEYIEDHFIMDGLKARLQANQEYNRLVCNCHEDSKLIEVITLVEKVYSAIHNKQNVGAQLQLAIRKFLDDFLSHMDQEEAVFQPLLDKYFNRHELKALRDVVFEQHQLWKDKVGAEKSLKMLKRKRDVDSLQDIRLDSLRFRKSYCEEVQDFFSRSSDSFTNLPDEVILHIFKYLNPLDLLHFRKVCRQWNRIALTHSLWKNLYPVQWFTSQWKFNFEDQLEGIDIEKLEWSFRQQEFFQGLSTYILPLIGDRVQKLVLSGTKSLSSDLAKEFIQQLPNLRILDLSYASIDDDAFKGLSQYNSLIKLQRLDLSGNNNISDMGLERISSCFFSQRSSVKSRLSHISLSGLTKITSEGLETLAIHSNSLVFLDLSGCYLLDSSHLKTFVKESPNLKPENLFYCSYIEEGPYQKLSNGCQNLDCPIRDCCQLKGIRN